jgi:hypothetical protein
MVFLVNNKNFKGKLIYSMMSRVGNRSGFDRPELAYEFFLSLNLAYGLSNAFFFSPGLGLLNAWPGLVACL